MNMMVFVPRKYYLNHLICVFISPIGTYTYHQTLENTSSPGDLYKFKSMDPSHIYFFMNDLFAVYKLYLKIESFSNAKHK